MATTTTRRPTPAQARKAAVESDYTALYAAAGLTDLVAESIKNIVVTTQERATKRFVELQTKQYGWTFMYMGCDQDAVEVGSALGIDPALSVTYARGKSADMFVAASAKIRRHRTDKLANPAAAMPAFTEEERRSVAE